MNDWKLEETNQNNKLKWDRKDHDLSEKFEEIDDKSNDQLSNLENRKENMLGRLKNHQNIPKRMKDHRLPPPKPAEAKKFELPKISINNHEEIVDDNLGKLPWRRFDERSYIDATKLKPGENKYGRNKFNQEASDKLQCDRSVPDTRSPL